MNIKTAHLGLFLAFTLILSYVEFLIPFQVGIPGVKLGLANLAVVLCLYLFGYREALFLTLTKAVVCGFLFGNLSMILYSIAGAVFSFGIMVFMKQSRKFHVPVISAVGGVMHNVGQLVIAYFTVNTYGIFYYVPVLICSGLITGILIGITASLLLPYLKKILERGTQI